MKKVEKILEIVKENKEFIVVCAIAAGLYLAGYKRGVKAAVRRK